MQNIMIFGIVTATIIVITRLLLEIIEARDRQSGMEVNHDDYRFGNILKKSIKDWWHSIRKHPGKEKKNGKRRKKEKK